MALYLGDKKISKLYLGDTECKKAYLGDTLLLDNSVPAGPSTILNENSWQTISDVTAKGEAQNYWKVGDTKTIVLNGTVGTLTLDNLFIDAFIIGFDHNQEIESPGEHRIHWALGKINGAQVALCDSKYNSSGVATDGTKYFNINHWGNRNYGGWSGCDLRYDVLGSTNVPPSNYGNETSRGRIGYDPVNYDIVNSPVSGTLMAALPVDLRKTMKPVTKYLDSYGSSNDVPAYVKPTLNYLVLPSEFEINGGAITNANSSEKNYQKQYDYFKNNNNIWYRHSNSSYEAYIFTSSLTITSNLTFCAFKNGASTNYGAAKVLAIPPLFFT